MNKTYRFEIQVNVNNVWTTVAGYNVHSKRDTSIVKVMAKYPSENVSIRIIPSGLEKLAETVERRRYQD